MGSWWKYIPAALTEVAFRLEEFARRPGPDCEHKETAAGLITLDGSAPGMSRPLRHTCNPCNVRLGRNRRVNREILRVKRIDRSGDSDASRTTTWACARSGNARKTQHCYQLLSTRYSTRTHLRHGQHRVVVRRHYFRV